MAKRKTIKTPINVVWSTDISAIPKGQFVEETRPVTVKGVVTEAAISVWRKDVLWIVITGNFDGKRQTIVNPSYWIPDENRWCGMIEGHGEIHAWAHHTGMGKDQGKPLLPDLVAA